MRTSARVLFACCAVTASAAGCESSDGGAEPVEDAAAPEAGSGDVAVADAAADAPASCEGACRATALTARFGGAQGGLERAQYGDDRDDAGQPTLHVEAHLGGDPACPNEQSPTPQRTLVLSGVRPGAAGEVRTYEDGARASFLDFQGDLVSAPIVRATAVKVTFGPSGTDWVAFELEATFPDGSIVGHVYAERCASLSR